MAAHRPRFRGPPPRPRAEARAAKAFDAVLDRLGEVSPAKASVRINAEFHFPISGYSAAIELPGVTLPEGTSLKVLGLRLGLGDAVPGAASIILDVGGADIADIADIFVVPALRVSELVSAALPALAFDAAYALAEKFVVQKG